MPCHPTLLTFFRRNENVPASLADAALIRLAEINDSPLLLTTDRDFQIYGRCWMGCRRGEAELTAKDHIGLATHAPALSK